LGGVMIALAAAFTSSVQDPDFWWHLRTGKWMLDNHRLPSHDLYTYTVSGHPWIDHEYLTEILMAYLNSWGGLALISLAFAALTMLGFLFLYRTADAGRRPYVIAGLGLALGGLAGGPIWGPRAQMITFTFTCLELYWIAGYLSGRSRSINYLPLVVALWANLHGGFVIAFVLLGIAIVAEVVDWVMTSDDTLRAGHRRRVRTLGQVLLISLVAVLATPHGLSVYTNPIETLTSPAQRRLIVEWFSPDFHQLVIAPFLAMILLLLAGFAFRRPSTYHLLLTIAVLALALESARNIAIFVAATTPILIATWSAAWEDLRTARGWSLTSSPPSPLLRGVTVVALLVITGVILFRIGTVLGQQAADTASNYPVAAADYLAAHPEVGTRMYNQYGWGGYLANRFYPDPNRRVFIFGEASVMGDSFLQQYQDIQTLRSDWQQVLDRYQVDYVVYNRHEALTNVLEALPDKWDCSVYQDAQAEICVRKK
jgi:hypothetical protein